MRPLLREGKQESGPFEIEKNLCNLGRQVEALPRRTNLAKEVDHHNVEDNVAEDKVGKRPLRRDVLELAAVLGVDLGAKAGWRKEGERGA
jgi:hypothetical protein